MRLAFGSTRKYLVSIAVFTLLLCAVSVAQQRCLGCTTDNTVHGCAVCGGGGGLQVCTCQSTACQKGCCQANVLCGNCINNPTGGGTECSDSTCCGTQDTTNAATRQSSWVDHIDFSMIAADIDANPRAMQITKLMKLSGLWAPNAEHCGHERGHIQSIDAKTTYWYQVITNANFLEIDVQIDPSDPSHDEVFKVRPSGSWLLVQDGDLVIKGAALKSVKSLEEHELAEPGK